MTPELAWLTLTALLASAMWIPFIVGVNVSPVGAGDFSRPFDPAAHPPWVHRAFRAHLNLLEQFLPFATLVIVAHLMGVSSAATVWATGAFFFIRLAHALGMITGIARVPLRPIIFSAGWICILVLGWEILTAG